MGIYEEFLSMNDELRELNVKVTYARPDGYSRPARANPYGPAYTRQLANMFSIELR